MLCRFDSEEKLDGGCLFCSHEFYIGSVTRSGSDGTILFDNW